MKLKYIHLYLLSLLISAALLSQSAVAQEREAQNVVVTQSQSASHLVFGAGTTGLNLEFEESSDLHVPERCLHRFEHLQRKQTWSNSYNAAGLHFIDFRSSSFVEGYFNKSDGDYVPFHLSNDSYDFGLRTSSYTKVGKTTFYGMLNYNNFLGQNMTNSGYIYPENYLYLMADNIPAEKSIERYYLQGGISSLITDRLIFGLNINYQTGMAAKRKDLRHRTDLLDFETTAGLIYRFNNFNLGANYYYRKFHEKVEFKQISDDEVIYSGFYLKGLWYGMTDLWSVSALHMDHAPIDVVQGVSIQGEYHNDNFKFYNQFSYKYRTGYAGKGLEQAFMTNRGDIWEYNGIIQIEGEALRHYIRFNSEYSDRKGYDKIYTAENVGGIDITVQYGEAKSLHQRTLDLNAEYELAIGQLKCNPNWNILVGYNLLAYNKVSTVNLPYYANQRLDLHEGYGTISKNFLFQKGMIDLSLTGRVSKGYGDMNNLKVVSGMEGIASESGIPYQHTELLHREWEFLSKGKVSGEAGFRYSHFLPKREAGAIYIDLKYGMTSAPRPEVQHHPGSTAGVFSVAIGYSF